VGKTTSEVVLAAGGGALIQFFLAAKDRAPLFVFGNGHSALDAHAHARLGRIVGFSEETFQ